MANENTNPEKSCIEQFLDWVKVNIFGIAYVILTIGLWIYLILNWDKCISMKFFDQFDGNNILFLVGIAMIITFFYDVEAKDFKFHRRKNQNINKQYQNERMNYQINQQSISFAQTSNIENEEGNKDEQTRDTDGN